MARLRTLKPAFFTHEVLAELSPLHRLLYQGLWCYADREGRLEDRPRYLKTVILPYDDCDVDRMLGDLAEREFIARYSVEGRRLLSIPAFLKHQSPHPRESPSQLPAPAKQRVKPARPAHGESEPKSAPEQANAQAATKHDLGTAQAQPRSDPATGQAEPGLGPDTSSQVAEPDPGAVESTAGPGLGTVEPSGLGDIGLGDFCASAPARAPARDEGEDEGQGDAQDVALSPRAPHATAPPEPKPELPLLASFRRGRQDEAEPVAMQAAWNAKADDYLPRWTTMPSGRAKASRAFLEKHGGLEGWSSFIARINASDFLCGRKASSDWKAPGVDWFLKSANLAKVLEGAYDNPPPRASSPPPRTAARATWSTGILSNPVATCEACGCEGEVPCVWGHALCYPCQGSYQAAGNRWPPESEAEVLAFLGAHAARREAHA